MGKKTNIKRVPRDLDTNFDFRFGDKLKKSGEIIVAHSTSSNLLPKILKEGLHRNTESVWYDSTKGKLYFELEPTRSYYGENVYGWKSVQKYGGANVTLYVKVKKDKLLVDSDDADLGERYQKGQREYAYDVPPEDVLGLHFVGIDIAPKDFIEFYEMFSDYKMEMGGLFHGSPHEFEKFTTEKMSSGEGQQVFGFGLYFTDVEEVAKHYAERLADKDVKIGNSTATKLNEELSNPVFTWIIHYVHDRGWNKEQIIEELNRQLSDTDWVSKNKWVEPNILQVIPILKENEISQIVEKRNLYKVTLSKGNENEIDWLLWDEPVTETQKQKISSNIDKLNDGKAKDRVISILKSPDWAGNNSGSKLYEYITDSFNKGMSGQKEASLFLLDAGIDGIKYKVGTLSGNEEKFEGFNYVVFDENLVTIEDMKKFNNGGNLMNSTKTEKMKNADNFYVNGGNIERELERSNKKPEEIISDEINFDTRKGLNRSDKVVPKEVIEEVEEQGMSLERLEELGLPIFKYQTQITVHGVFEGIGSGRVGGYKNLLANQNQTLGIKYNAIDLEKKRIISKTLRLDRDFNNIEGGFTSRMDSRGFEIYKRRIAENKEQYLKVVEELKEESKKIPSNFIGKKIVNAYNIWGRIVVELLIDFKAIKQDNLWSFISSITDGRVSNEQEFNTLLEKEKKQEDERNAVYKKEREEREAKEKALLNELKEKSTYSKLTSFPTSDEFIVAALGSSYGDTIIRVYSVFKNKTGRKVYSVNNYKNWSEVPTLISDDVKNSRGNKFFDESTIKLLTKYIEKGMLFDIYEKKKIEVKKVQPSSIYSETKTETIPAGDELLLDDSRYQLVKSKHTKTGDVIYLFKLKSRVDREDYKKIEANVKLIRGYYSSFVTAFVLKSAISANEAEMLLKGSVLEHKKENGGEISDNEKINEAAKEEVNKLVNETDITKEEAVKEMKEGVKVEEEHRETLEKLDKGEITVEEAVAETASVHIEEKKDYYTGGLNPMENKDKSNDELKKQLGEVELQLFNKAEERVPNVNLARTIELAENIAKLENKERKSDLAYFAEALQYTTSDAENDVYARFWASDLEYMVGQSNSGFVGLERAIEVGAIEGGESFLEHIDLFKKGAETFRELTNQGHKALIQNFVKRFVLSNELSTQQDYIWMAINDVYKLIYVAKENENDTTKIADYINELMNKYQAQTELEKLANESAQSIKSETKNVVEDGIEYTEGKYENGTDVYGANVRYKGELSVIPLGRYETKEEVELRANKVLEQLKQKYEGTLSETQKIEQEVRTDFPTADEETVKHHVQLRLQANEDKKVFEKVKSEYPIVIEWSEGTSQKNIGFDYLYELDKKIKSFGVTNEPKSYYIKTKVWFRDYPHDGKTDYVTFYNGHDVSDFNPETEDVIDFLKKHHPNFDWTIYEYGNNYKFGFVPEPKFKEGDLVRVSPDVNDLPEFGSGKNVEFNYGVVKSPTIYSKDESRYKKQWEYLVVDFFNNQKLYEDIREFRLRLTTEDEMREELNERKVRLGEADLLVKQEAEILTDKYISEINRLHNEYIKSGDNKYWKEQFEQNIYDQFYNWFSEVVCRYPAMLTQWLNMQVEQLPNYKGHLLNGFIDVDFALNNLLQFINSLNKMNVGKTKPVGIYELIHENLTYDGKLPKVLDYEVDPSSSELVNIMKPFMMKDDFRPIMSSINFDKYGATSTDAHRLMFIKGKTDKIGIYGFGKTAEVPIIQEGKEVAVYAKRGKYLVAKKGMKYPKYEAVIPTKYENVITLNREQVGQLLITLKTFKNNSYFIKSTGISYFSFSKGKLSWFNIHFMIDLFEAWLKIGFDNKLELTNTTYSSYKGKETLKKNVFLVSPDLAKFTNNLKGSGSIVMGVMVDDSGSAERDIVRGEMYLDMASVTVKTAGVNDDLFTDYNVSYNTYGAETEKNEIGELEIMIELMEDTVKESPTEENKDYLDLLKETLVDLKTNNENKFNRGGKMCYFNGGKVHASVSYKNGGLFDENELNNLEQINNINNTLFYRYYPIGVNPFEISFDESNSYGYGIYFLDNPYFYKNKLTNSRLLTITPRVKNPFVFNEQSKGTLNSEYAEALLSAMKNDNLKDKNEFTRKMVEAGYDSLVAVEARGTYLVLFSNDPELYDVESDLSSDVIDEKVKNELSEKLDLSIKNGIERFPDLNKTEAEFLYHTFSKIVENGNQKEQPVWLTSDGFKGSMKKVLLKKNYIDDFWSVFNKPMSYDRSEYSLTRKGINFIKDVQNSYESKLTGNKMVKGGDVVVGEIDTPRALGTALKRVFKNEYGVDIDTRYIKTVRGLDGSWYEITTFSSGHTIPNEVRKEMLELSYGKPITELGVSNPDNIGYGNVRGQSVSVLGKHWKEWLKTKKYATGGEVDNSFDYMMLSRLESDCEYYLGHGNRSERNLWAGSVDGQIEEMKRLWNTLPVKPEWLSMEDILDYEKKMKEQYAKGGGIENEKNNFQEINGNKYFSYDFDNKGNKWSVLIAWGKYNHVNVTKKTNNPFGNKLGTEFNTLGEAVDNYKDVNIKSNILFAGSEAKKHGYEPKYAKGGEIQFIPYKDTEIMFSPKNKYQEKDLWYSNDEEFTSLEAAKKYIDDGSKPSQKTINAYRHGAMEKGGVVVSAEWGNDGSTPSNNKDYNALYAMFPDNHKEAKNIWNQLSEKQKEGFLYDLDVTDAASEHIKDSWLEFINAKSEKDWLKNATNWDEMAKGGVLKANDIPLGSWLEHKGTKTKVKVWNVDPQLGKMQLQDIYGNKNNKWYSASEWKLIPEPTSELEEIKKVWAEQGNVFEYAKGGKVGDSKEIYYISYLNKDNNFRQTDKEFKGENAYEKAIKWGRENLENFNLDMVRSKLLNDGGEVGENNAKERLINILSSLDESDLRDFVYHIGSVDVSYVDDVVVGYKNWVNGLPKHELDMLLWRMKMPYFYQFSPKDNYSTSTPVPSKFATYDDFYEKKYAKGGNFSSLSDLKKMEIEMMNWSEMEVVFEPRGDNGLEGYDRNMTYYYKAYDNDSGKKRYLITNGYNSESGKVFGDVDDVSSIIFGKYFKSIK